MSVIERLLQALDATNVSQTELCNYLNLGTSTVSNWKNRKTDPPAKYIFPICEFMKLSLKWLLTGEGDMRNENAESDNSDDEIELLRDYKKLKKEDKIKVLERTQTLLELKRATEVEAKKEATQIVTTKVPITIPPEEPEEETSEIEMLVYEQSASAGFGNYLYEDSNYEIMTFDESDIPDGADFGIRISGDSMKPDILEGDIVWVKEQIKIENGEIGIFILNGEAYCKKLHIDYDNRVVYLVSLNKRYKPMRVGESDFLRTVGKVLL